MVKILIILIVYYGILRIQNLKLYSIFQFCTIAKIYPIKYNLPLLKIKNKSLVACIFIIRFGIQLFKFNFLGRRIINENKNA
jgi:hypothetical protein